MLVTAAPWTVLSTTFTFKASRRLACRARFALASNGTAKDRVPAGSEPRTSLPTRTGAEWPALASDALVASSSTSRRPPTPAWGTANEPCTDAPCRAPASFSVDSEALVSGEPGGRRRAPPASPPASLRRAPGGRLAAGGAGRRGHRHVVVPFALTVTVPVISGP